MHMSPLIEDVCSIRDCDSRGILWGPATFMGPAVAQNRKYSTAKCVILKKKSKNLLPRGAPVRMFLRALIVALDIPVHKSISPIEELLAKPVTLCVLFFAISLARRAAVFCRA